MIDLSRSFEFGFRFGQKLGVPAPSNVHPYRKGDQHHNQGSKGHQYTDDSW